MIIACACPLLTSLPADVTACRRRVVQRQSKEAARLQGARDAERARADALEHVVAAASVELEQLRRQAPRSSRALLLTCSAPFRSAPFRSDLSCCFVLLRQGACRHGACAAGSRGGAGGVQAACRRCRPTARRGPGAAVACNRKAVGERKHIWAVTVTTALHLEVM
jgi:hypothetical protein